MLILSIERTATGNPVSAAHVKTWASGDLGVTNKIPNSVIGAVSSVIAEHYYSHSKLNALFMESGAPGNVPEGTAPERKTTPSSAALGELRMRSTKMR